MRLLTKLMPRFVSALAIRSWRDLIWKSVCFYLVFNLLGIPIDIYSYPAGERPPLFNDFWLITLVSTPVLALQFGVVTYLDRLQSRLAQLAMTDVLTELPNRRSFITRTNKLRETTPEGAVFILDADHFKRINDTYGHAAGDACLQAIAQTLLTSTMESDVIGRLGGEEFAVFLPAADQAKVTSFGDRLTKEIRTQLETETHSEKRQVALTMSIGAAYAKSGQTLDHLLSRADTALYDAKDAGRARMVVWDDQLPAHAKAS